MQTFFKTEDEFYNAETSRRSSPEVDYGVHWTMPPWPHKWRVSYVKATGEVYAVHGSRDGGPLILLGKVPPDQEERPHGIYYRTLENILDGYPKACLEGSNIQWVRDKLIQSGHAV